MAGGCPRTGSGKESAFLPYDERVRLIKQALRPGYAAVRAERVREP